MLCGACDRRHENETVGGRPGIPNRRGQSGSGAAVLRPGRSGADVRDDAFLPCGDGVRYRQAGGVAVRVAHEVSCQKDGRRGCGRGRVMRVIIVPPQQEQRSGLCNGAVSRACSAVDCAGTTSSSLRQSASFAARWPLARKP